MNIKIPIEVLTILNRIHSNGYEAYVVGGCVRDSVLGLTPQDWDICTSAKPHDIIRIFHDYNVAETGLKHGTVTIIADSHNQYEVTTYRKDGKYLDNRRPSEVLFVSDIIEDLARRDFTINAMAYNVQMGLVDHFNGLSDLNSRVIRCVGDADKRFSEDALRIMRALRFASIYGFQIAELTKISLKKHKNLLSNIAFERISVELCRILCGQNVYEILNEYSDVISVFIPEISQMFGFWQNNLHHYLDVWQHTILSVRNVSDDRILKLTMLLHDIGKPSCYSVDVNNVGHFYSHNQVGSDIASSILRRLKFDNATISQVKKIILYHDSNIDSTGKSVKRWLNKIGEDTFRKLIEVKRADISAQGDIARDERLSTLNDIGVILDGIIEQNQCFSIKNLVISGRDLIEIGIPSGANIGILLKLLTDMVVDEKVSNSREELLEIAAEFRDKVKNTQ